jgi:16S rRNA (guanine527-N7)-methyltransferase
MSESAQVNAAALGEALRQYGLVLPDPHRQAAIARYCEILWRENRVLNLTRHLDYPTFVARDLNDVLHVSTLIRPAERLLDIGSGGGVPGLLLAIVRPDLSVSLCESTTKKARVLERIVSELQLDCRIYNRRAEVLLTAESFDVCVARAVGPLWKICTWFRGHWSAMGRLLAFKGSRWEEEVERARRDPAFAAVNWRVALEYPMIGTNSSAYILKLWAKGAPEPP